MNAAEIKIATREFMSRTFSVHELSDGDDIFEMGFVNSLFALQLVMFVEKRFAITVEDEDLKVENFRSIDGITALVLAKTGNRSGQDADCLADPTLSPG